MSEILQTVKAQLQAAFSAGQAATTVEVAIYLLIGGLLACYLRLLYARFGGTPSDPDAITRVFPLLTMITTAVIAVVKSSLTLSLGLVGALSIVRFRAAIKEPEELVYLFLCIAVGLSLGASQPLLAVAIVLVATIYSVGMFAASRGRRQQQLMLTVTGSTDDFFRDGEPSILGTIESMAGACSLHRFDIEDGRGQVRLLLRSTQTAEIDALIVQLRKRLPECEFSYVNTRTPL